uniref:Cation channel sperm-associated protein subunit epsilon n=1 Tax=Chelonoidis abingdonii TaxID=106734 RepID=A0A8C0J3T5_CHEAB
MPGFMLMEFVYSASPSMLMWNKEMVYYSYKNNTINGFVMVAGLNQKLSEVSQGSTIHQLVIDYFGNTVIKMKNNVMIFFKVEMKNAVELPQWEKKSKNIVLYLNPSGNLDMLFINGSSIHRKVYPLKTEMFTYIHGFQDICPYLVFQHNMDLNVYYLDMGDEVTFWAQIVYIENLGLSTIVEIYRPELLMQTTDVNYEIARGICTKNQVCYIKIVPVYIELQPKTYLAKMWRCYILDSYGEILTPLILMGVLQLTLYYTCIVYRYDGSAFVKTVEANFILWEIHGRSDYSYNSSMKQVGCLREAQTWISMLEEHENSTLDEIWGPQNYRSCFQSELGPLGDLNQLYQIMNHSGYNSLIWPTEYSGIYVFRVKIVDPNFRGEFENLPHLFLIESHLYFSPNIGEVAGFSILILSIFGGILIVSYFRYVKIYRALIYVDPLPSHDQQDQTRKTAHELKKDQ